MNSPYGSLDHLQEWSWYDPVWTNTLSTEEGAAFEDNSVSTSSADFTHVSDDWQCASWSNAAPGAANATHLGLTNEYHDFYQTEQVWSTFNNRLGPTQRMLPSTTSNNDRHTAEMARSPSSIATTMPLLAGLGITGDDPCDYPWYTAFEQRAVAPEVLEALFPSPMLPLKQPSSLYDDDGQPLQKQKPRFEGDIYTAVWVSGEGTLRSGFCGFCESWHKLKDSAYWYHMHYSHGISCNTGRPLERPNDLRWSRAANVCEAHCSSCQEWISIGKGIKMRTAYWRHAYKCMSKAMVKGKPKEGRCGA